MKQHLIVLAVICAVPLATADYLNEDLNSTNPNVSFSSHTGFAIDDQLGVEVVERLGDFSGWVWPVMTITFPDTVIETGAELDLHARYHQEEYTWDNDGDPNTPDFTRTPYTDANIWLILRGPGGDYDLSWADNDGWKHIGDVWRSVVKDLGAYVGVTVNQLEIRSTNWDAPLPNNDYYHFSNITITPEPNMLGVLVIGVLGLVKRR